MAFNNIYVTIATRDCIKPRYNRNSDGTIKLRENLGVQIPEVDTPSERELIDHVFKYFNNDLKDELILHENTMIYTRKNGHVVKQLSLTPMPAQIDMDLNIPAQSVSSLCCKIPLCSQTASTLLPL